MTTLPILIAQSLTLCEEPEAYGSLNLNAPVAKSPLRYPGGKTRAVKQLLRIIPPGAKTLCSPFVGGASIELAAASRGIRVYGYDAFAPVVNFWESALEDASLLAEMARAHYPLSRTAFYDLQKRYFSIENKHEQAAAFYALNRASYSGTTLSGGMSPGHPRFTLSAIARLSAFSAEGFSVRLSDFTQSIPQHPNDFLYLDPPYANGGALYGERGDMHKDFDHALLADMLKGRDGWVLSYNDCSMVRNLYEGYSIIKPEWAYGMSNEHRSNEVVILSKNLV